METTTPNLGGVKRGTVMEFGVVLKGPTFAPVSQRSYSVLKEGLRGLDVMSSFSYPANYCLLS